MLWYPRWDKQLSPHTTTFALFVLALASLRFCSCLSCCCPRGAALACSLGRCSALVWCTPNGRTRHLAVALSQHMVKHVAAKRPIRFGTNPILCNCFLVLRPKRLVYLALTLTAQRLFPAWLFLRGHGTWIWSAISFTQSTACRSQLSRALPFLLGWPTLPPKPYSASRLCSGRRAVPPDPHTSTRPRKCFNDASS